MKPLGRRGRTTIDRQAGDPQRRPGTGYWTLDEVQRRLDLVSEEYRRNTCRACGHQIRVMVQRGTGYCSQACEKAPF